MTIDAPTNVTVTVISFFFVSINQKCMRKNNTMNENESIEYVYWGSITISFY